jgi:hypothetical protein
MASKILEHAGGVLAASLALLAAAGCGETFVSSSSGTGGAAGSSNAGAAGNAGSPACNDGETQKCYEGDPANAGKGICTFGQQQCQNGVWGKCDGGDVMPTTETCDGKDSDCDGTKNNGCKCNAGETQTCFPFSGGRPGVGPCKNGMQTCDDGILSSCKGAVGPSTEDCANMGVDDDCNGAPDDIEKFGGPCNTPLSGICKTGHFHCEAGSPGLVCKADKMPTAETCDGQDDDCNEVVDDVTGPCPLTASGKQCTGFKGCAGNSETCTVASFFSDDFADDFIQWAMTGQWEIGPAEPGGGSGVGHPDPGEDHSNGDDDRLAGIVIGGDVSSQSGPAMLLTSPKIDLTTSDANTAWLSFYRWLNSDIYPAMTHFIEVSEDGGASWLPLWNNEGVPLQEDGWSLQLYDVSKHRSPSFRVRFGVKVTASVVSASSWNIDDVVIASCPPK